MKKKHLDLTIQSPRGDWDTCFPKTAKVEQVIEDSRQHFGFEPGAFVLRRKKTNEVLAPERPLVSYGIESGETLLLVPEMGSGV